MKRLGLLFLLMTLMGAEAANALELGLGIAAVEEGDDRFRPAVQLHVSPMRNWFAHGYYYGRKYGPIIEKTMLVSASYKLDIFKFFGTDFMYGSCGLTIMNEQTELKFSGDSENSSSEQTTNAGVNFGVFGDLPIPRPLFLRFGMESHHFFAGVDGAILMATGRKLFFTLSSGVQL